LSAGAKETLTGAPLEEETPLLRIKAANCCQFSG
jgi:hypothetical protein